MGPSWKTTLGGIITACGAALTAAFMFGGVPQWVGAVGAALSALGPAWLGVSARDNKVTSERAKAR